MINITPKVNHIEKITGNVSFSNYQIIIAQKYERAVNRFNSLLSKKLLIEEKAPIYYFEFIINKDLKEEEYLILMDVSICHIQSGSEKGFYYACNTLENIFDLFSLKCYNIHQVVGCFDMKINNPALTSQILVAYARATMKMDSGCYTTIEVPIIKMLEGNEEDLIKQLV